MNLPPITIDDIHFQDKRYRYTPDLIPAAIYVSSENFVSTLTTPSGSHKILLLTYDDTNPCNSMKKYEPYRDRVKKDTDLRIVMQICEKNRLYCSTRSDKDEKLYYWHVFQEIIQG